MNGAFVVEALRKGPPESLALKPCDPVSPILGYFVSRAASADIGGLEGPALCDRLTGYIFDRHPYSLDLVTSMAHRYEQARGFIADDHQGQEELTAALHRHFQKKEAEFVDNALSVASATIPSSGSLKLPDAIRSRSLTWNRWAQQMAVSGRVDELFKDPINRHGVKVATGDLLPAGNLWVEVVQGIARVRTRAHRGLDVEQQWGLGQSNEYGSGLDDWYVMTHIAEKGILNLSESIKPGMVDGSNLTKEVYLKSYEQIAELIKLNPDFDIKGILSDGSWIYSTDLARHFPDQHVSELGSIAGTVIELGPADEIGLPIQVQFATGEHKRREAYCAGEYAVGVAARFISPDGIDEVLSRSE